MITFGVRVGDSNEDCIEDGPTKQQIRAVRLLSQESSDQVKYQSVHEHEQRLEHGKTYRFQELLALKELVFLDCIVNCNA